MAWAASRRTAGSMVLSGQEIRARRNLRDLGYFYTLFLGIMAFLAVVFVLLWSKLTVVNLGYEISRADSSRARLIDQNKRLKLEFMKLKSPERIERIASTELKLVYPSGEQIIDIK